MRFPVYKKIFSITIVIGIVWIFVTSFDIDSYRWYHTPTSFISGEQTYIDPTLRTAPLPEDWIVDMIHRAENRVWVGVYTFTLPRLREALLDAKKRSVDVRVIVEKNPFGNTRINVETLQFFRDNGINFHESSESQFAFMHAKYMVIDDEWIVSTANWTRSSFGSNREFFLIGDDPTILVNLIWLFADDFSGKVWKTEDNRILAWPTHARESLLDFLSKTDKSIDIYAPSFSDERMIKALDHWCRSGIWVRIILADYDGNDNQDMQSTCIQRRISRWPLHAKWLIRDKTYAFLGSFNFTQNSLENNREIGLFIFGKSAKTLSQTFDADWKLAEVALR
jgi:cardiolipin synthase A/B